MLFTKFPYYKQLDQMDCGPTCLRMIARHYGKSYSAHYLRQVTYKGKGGVSLLGISDAAEQIGFRTMLVKCPFSLLEKEKPLPFIAHWRQSHFVVVYQIKGNKVYVADPAGSRLTYTKAEFCTYWYSNKKAGEEEGVALLLHPTPALYQAPAEEDEQARVGFGFFARYFLPHKSILLQLGLGMLLGSLFSLITPFLTQATVDQGIENKSISFIYAVLIAQTMIFVGNTTISIIRAWLMQHMSTRLNIAVISDFLTKLMKLPLGFFDRKNMGDILQRMSDHSRIQSFLTDQPLQMLFALVNVVVYSFVMLSYSVELYGLFILFSILEVVWMVAFLRKRKELDYKRFNQAAANSSSEVSIIQAMAEIKLNTCEKQKRWEWERIQIKMFKIGLKTLGIEQIQSTGTGLMAHLQSTLVSIWAAKEVISGDMTLGMMMATTQMLGQLSGPISQFVHFVQQAQDAKISLERIGEIHNKEEEEQKTSALAYVLPEKQDIVIENLHFRYSDPHRSWVLEDLNLTIPYGKVTAIVGESGSGKTTLLKLLLRFYEPEQGEIRLGDTPLSALSPRSWRKRCGVVMQEGHIFSSTIAGNIAIADEIPDKKRLLRAADIANAREFIESLPLNYNTKVGPEGLQLSTGQKQRLMIARAAYKNPSYLFFDEATSSLDAKNEREISQKLEAFNQGRTAVIIAHRLSTVKHADNIIVLDKGSVVEQGTHEELAASKGLYYQLVKNQLELAEA